MVAFNIVELEPSVFFGQDIFVTVNITGGHKNCSTEALKMGVGEPLTRPEPNKVKS
jgi:hypothetical protein